MGTQTQVGHTPGPWRIGGPSVAHGVQIFKDYDGIRATADVVCTMPKAGRGRTANARLIAAAPKLLAACKAVDDFYKPVRQGSSGGMNTGRLSPEVCDQVRAAIAGANK